MKLDKFSFILIVLAIFLNPFFLKNFTIDGNINLIGLKTILYLTSFTFFIFSIFLLFTKDKKLLINFSFFIFFLIITVILFEIFILKVFPKLDKVSQITTHNNYEFKATYKINKYGFREINLKEKLKNKNKVLFVGDSFVFGSAVDEPYVLTKLLETKFKDNNLNISFINLGIPGTSPREYLNVLKHNKTLVYYLF